MFIFSSHWNLKEKETKNKGRKAINPSSTLAFHKKPKSNQPSSTRFFHSDQIIHHLYLQPPPTFPTFAHLFTSTVTTIIILTNPHWQPHNNQVASIFFPLQSWEPQHQFQERTTVVEPLRLRVFYTIVVLFSSSFSSVSPIKVTTLIIDDHFNALQAFLNNAASNPTTLISLQN